MVIGQVEQCYTKRRQEKAINTNVPDRQERTFAEIKRISSAGLDGPELLRRVAGRIKLAVPCEVASSITLDPASNLVMNVIPEDHSDEARGAFLDRVYFEEDLYRIAHGLRERRVVQLLSENTRGKLDRSVRYRELLRPRGHGDEMDVLFVDTNAWGVMALRRKVGDPDFSSNEVKLMRRIAPHVGAGLKAATLRSRAISTDRETRDAPGVLTLDRSGHVVSHTPSAEHWLRDLEDLRPAWQESRGLPVTVRVVANAVKRSLDPASSRDLDLVPRVRVRARSGNWLTLYGSLSEPTPGHPSETVIVIEPTRPEEVAWLNVAAYGLSSREEEVLKLVVRGFSSQQISQTLYISENTVQRHLSNIFEKVGVRSRKELLKQLFFEDLLPGMIGV